MERTSVQRLARVLRVLVKIVFVCNIIALFFVPVEVDLHSRHTSLPEMVVSILSFDDGIELLFLGVMWSPMIYCGFLANVLMDAYVLVLTLFLWVCGVCTAVILWQGKRVLDTILKGNPFVMDNAKSLNRAAVCCFVISGAALVRTVWGLVYYQNISPMFTYNALFVPIFLMAGLLCMVVSALFRQAAELKAENDLTV